MKISYHRYTLQSRSRLNARSVRKEHEGLLLRLEVHSGVYGYGNVHPWPELGDYHVEQSLARLRAGKTDPLVRSALSCARADGKARKEGVNLLNHLAVPLSHATIVGGGEGAVQEVEYAVQRGFSCLKLKVGKSFSEDLELLEKLHHLYPQLMLRLDFNHSSSSSKVAQMLEAMSNELRSVIDFLEDPFLNSELNSELGWQRLRQTYGVEVGVDRDVETLKGIYDVSVVKPALHQVDSVLEAAHREGRRAVLTSYMDHPFGQTFAAWRAGEANEKYHGVVDICGLMTHGLYEVNAFSERLGTVQPEWSYVEGTGLGFDDLLESIPWIRM